MLPNKEIIESIRQKFLKLYKTQPTLYHENDIKNILENDWPIERFVLVNSNEEKALQAVIKAMQWRKSFGINDFNDLSFPYELYKMNVVVNYGHDKDGRPLMRWNLRNFHKCGELETLMRQYVVYQYECIDRQTSHQGWAYIFDISGSGLSNADLDLGNSFTEILQNYYPRAIKNWFIVEVPWILVPLSKLFVAFMNEEMKSIVKIVNKEELPVHLGGTHSNVINEIPSGAKGLDQMSDLGFTKKQIEKIYSTFKCLKE